MKYELTIHATVEVENEAAAKTGVKEFDKLLSSVIVKAALISRGISLRGYKITYEKK